jgi:predicted secreted protein
MANKISTDTSYISNRRTKMKKYWITVMLTVLAIFAIGGTIAAVSADTNATLALTTADSGKQITVDAGGSFTVTLDSNPSTGFAWSISEITDEGIIDDVSNEFQGADTGMVGAGGQEVWTFKTIDKGTSTIEMQYSRSWETGVEPGGTFNVTVVVK